MELDYRTIFKEFNKIRIDYLVVGGLAVNLHGVPRMTYDIDLVISLESENILRLVNKLAEWGYRPKFPVDPKDLTDPEKRNAWIREKGMKAMNFYSDTSPIGEIDLLFDLPIPFEGLKQRAVSFELEEDRIPTVSIHDLIELKIQAGRKQDLADVEHLKIILER